MYRTINKYIGYNSMIQKNTTTYGFLNVLIDLFEMLRRATDYIIKRVGNGIKFIE